MDEKTGGIRFDTLEKLWTTLHCKIENLLKIIDKKIEGTQEMDKIPHQSSYINWWGIIFIIIAGTFELTNS